MLLFIILINVWLICVKAQNSAITSVHYKLNFELDFVNLIIKGRTTISIEIRNRIDKIQLDGRNLNIFSLTCLKIDDNTEISCDYYSLTGGNTIDITFVPQLTTGLYQLVFDYEAKLNEEEHGFFRVKYRKITGEQGMLAITNLQYDHARELFPCLDSPEFPARFNVSIIRPHNYITLCNTKIATQVVETDGRIVDIFEITEAIPTYMLAIAVIDFGKITGQQFDIYSHNSENLAFLISATERSISVLNQLIVGKSVHVNQIVLPDDCLSQTIANGLIVYRESDVLYNAGRHTTKDKQIILKKVAHAIAKQWSYTIYSATLWSRYWITEGLALFYQNEVLSIIEPDWRLHEQFVVEEIHNTLETDYGDNAIILNYNNSNFNPNKLIFNDPRFSLKAGILIRMLFKQNSDLQVILNHPIMDSWGNNAGYPLVTVLRDYKGHSTILRQEKFGLNESIIWQIPIDFHIDNTTIETEMNSPTVAIINPIKAESWILINDQQYNYFRTNYDERNWRLIRDFLKIDNIETISPVNRAQLIDNAANLLQFGYISSDIYLDLISYISRENDFIPLLTFFKTANKIKILLSRTRTQIKFMEFVRGLVVNLYDFYGPTINPSETHIDRLNRIQIIDWMCNFHHQPCLDEMNKLLISYQINHPDLEESVYCGGMRSGKLVDFLWLSTQFSLTRKDGILHGMGCTDNEEILTYYIQILMGDSVILELEPNDAVKAFLAICEGSDTGVDLALDLIVNHFNQITNKFNHNQITVMVLVLAKRLVLQNHIDKIDEMIAFVDDDYLGILQRARVITLENINWRISNLKAIDRWLDQYQETTKSSTIPTTITTTTNPMSDSTTQCTSITTDIGSGFNAVSSGIFMLIFTSFLIVIELFGN